MVNDHRQLRVWQKAMDLVVEAHRLARLLPDEERFGLRSQLRRSATSIPANIAEGNGRGARRDYIRFLSIANGSLRELETHIEVICRLELVPRSAAVTANRQAQDVGRMLTRLRQSLSRRLPPKRSRDRNVDSPFPIPDSQ